MNCISVPQGMAPETSRARSHQQAPAILPNGDSIDNGNGNPLDRIFKPPVEMLFRGTFQEARRFATEANRWLIVNVQELSEFPSLCVNRDIWGDQSFKELVDKSFVLWQVYHDGSEGRRFVQFYKVSSFPFICIVDPRTGEKIMSTPTTPKELFQKCIFFSFY